MTRKAAKACFLGSQNVYTITHARAADSCQRDAATGQRQCQTRTGLWLTGHRVSIWACSHVWRNRHVHVNAPSPVLTATIAWEKGRNETDEQLFIMLLPMRRHSASAGSQWRGAANHDANPRARIIRIAKIGLLRGSHRAREKMKLFVIGAGVEGQDESDARRSLATLVGRLHGLAACPPSWAAGRTGIPQGPAWESGIWGLGPGSDLKIERAWDCQRLKALTAEPPQPDIEDV